MYYLHVLVIFTSCIYRYFDYQGISLLIVPGKVYATVFDKRIRAITEESVLEEKGAFRRQRSCIDQLFTVRQLEEKIIEKNKTMNMVCIDLEKAFDTVNRELLWIGGREIWCQEEAEGSSEVSVPKK